jgi:hypothetical protein
MINIMIVGLLSAIVVLLSIDTVMKFVYYRGIKDRLEVIREDVLYIADLLTEEDVELTNNEGKIIE